MTSKTLRVVFLSILLMAFTVSAVNADWETRTVNSPYDDGIITETGGKFFDSPWVSIKEPTVNHNAYFAFRNIEINQSAKIENAYLQVSAPFPWNYNQSLPVTVYGLKTTGDIGSWNPTPDLNSYPGTVAFTNWDADPLISSVQVNITITDLVNEIYQQPGWIGGNDMVFRISSVGQSGGSRWATAYDSDPLRATKLFIEWSPANDTVTYYRGYKIIKTFTAGNDVSFTWTDVDDSEYKLTTIEATDYKTVDLNAEMTEAPDAVCSVGTDIYMIWGNTSSLPTLRRTSDRGITWVNLGNFSGDSEHHALVYDQSDTIHIAYGGSSYDTYYINFTVSTQTFSTPHMIFDGAYNIGEHRAFWEADNNTVWFTRFGGAPGQSTRRPRCFRKKDGIGAWESSVNTLTDMRDSDLTKAGGKMYWSIFQEGGTSANRWIRLYELTNYSDMTSWANVGGLAGGLNGYNDHDLGTWNDDPVISYNRLAESLTYQLRWTGAAWDTWLYNLTLFFPASQPETHHPKMYYNSDGDLWMGLIVEQDSGYSLIIKDWDDYLFSEPVPPTKVIKATGHEMDWLGGDMNPFSTGQTVWTVTDEEDNPVNSTCLDLETTLEEIQACLDDIIGVDPQDPNPPGSSYPDDGVGALTRFNIRFYIWMMGWIGVVVPMFAMAYRNWSIEYYFYFAVIIIAGVGLLWSIGSI